MTPPLAASATPDAATPDAVPAPTPGTGTAPRTLTIIYTRQTSHITVTTAVVPLTEAALLTAATLILSGETDAAGWTVSSIRASG